MSTWTLTYDSIAPEEERLRETLTSTGNGFFCTRGAAEWSEDDEAHYAGTYAHGLYNREATILAGQPVVNEDLVNLPNWLPLQLRIEGGPLFELDTVEVLSYEHTYDIRAALVSRRLRFRDGEGRETTLVSRRFVSMDDRHLGALHWTLTAENWSGRVEVLTALDGQVQNRGVPRYEELEGRHLAPELTEEVAEDCVAIRVQTRQSLIRVAQAARTRAYRQGESEPIDVDRTGYEMEDYIHQVLAFELRQGEPVEVEKMVTFYTSRDDAISEPLHNASTGALRAERFEAALDRHRRAWDGLWGACDVRIPADDRVQHLVRFHIAHVLQVCSPHTADLDAGVPARGLNGEAYRGHIFWDELYIYPFLNHRLPDVTRGLLMYRYRRLDEARRAAREAGHRGAMYPWQSGTDGSEETQVVHLNPKSGQWDPDLSQHQRHVNAAIFYNVWQYYRTTGDAQFIVNHGAEMMLEIVRFWASITHFDPERERYEIHGVMGPDEFHEKYVGSDEPGLHNNAYTNVMVAWMSQVAVDLVDRLPTAARESLGARIGLDQDEVDLWEDMSRRMFVPFHGDGLISQFEGYEDLEELEWDAYRAAYGRIQRLDRILKAEGDTPDRYKLAKQADTLMLFFLFPDDELRGLFERLGYEYDDALARRNAEYYEARTSHGSTLSFVVHAGILADLDPQRSWEMFMTALESDIGDVQGGTTAEGIHMGVMAGTLDLVQRGYLGTELRDGVLWFEPSQVERLDGLSMPMRVQGTPLTVTLSDGALRVTVLDDGFGHALRVAVGDDEHEIAVGAEHVFELPADVPA